MVLRYDATGGSADFIMDGRKRFAVEVGWGEKGERQVLSSMKDHDLAWGLVISEGGNIRRKGKVLHVPMELFLSLT